MIRFFVSILVVGSVISACSPVSKRSLNKAMRATESRFQDHSGFVLFDPLNARTLFQYNEAKYFTPASNTKIFTFFAGLKILGDSVPALEYVQRDDSLIFWGTGDPSFLYTEVYFDSTVYQFLKNASTHLYFSNSNFDTRHLGPGWAWDDFSSDYSAEKSPFPIYGNIVSIIADQHVLKIAPAWFNQHFTNGRPKDDVEIDRHPFENKFVAHPSRTLEEVREIRIPFRTDSLTLTSLLADTLKRPVSNTFKAKPSSTNVIHSIHVDSLYRVMMQESDNFIAEQILLMVSNVLSDTLKPEIAIDFVSKNYLADLPDKIIWRDGSGLSRYNLFTPRSIVSLWNKIYDMVPRARLFPLLATGGVNGTVKKWYSSKEPYIFGKTGSLSNNHCISGFLITKKGRVLIFSFMNSNFTVPGNDIRRNMQNIFETIYEHY